MKIKIGTRFVGDDEATFDIAKKFLFKLAK